MLTKFETKSNRVKGLTFHPNDDQTIRIWNWQSRTCISVLTGHNHYVMCASFHPKEDLVVSASLDQTVRVWDIGSLKKKTVSPADDLMRFTQMNSDLFGGVDAIVKYVLEDRFLRFYEYSTQKDAQVIPIRRPGTPSLNQSPRTLSYSPTENAVLICSDLDSGSYELYIIPKDSVGRSDVVQDAKRGTGGSAVFIARNRFAVLEKSTSQTPFVRYVVWSNDMENVALLSKHTIIIASKKLLLQCTLHETIRVKSGAWDDNGVFIYTTLNHIKYCLPNGDSGIIRTLDVPIYITKVSGNTIFCLDRDGKNRAITINATEYIFKLALLRKRYDHVMSMIKNSQLCGQAMIAYLQQKGFPEVALHFVEDERVRFNLALESGNISVAVASATEINEKEQWYRLGVEALRQGNAGIVEFAYQQTKNFERLSFLYLITGKLDKLSKLMKIAEVKNNVMALVYDFSQQEEKLKSGYKATTSGKLTEALRLFLSILHTIPLVVVESRSEVDEVKELVIIVKEYVLGLKMELKRRETKDDPVRQQELAAYFTHCNLQLPHLRLALFSAMGVCYKSKNLATAYNFAKRFLETNPVESQAKTARQIVQAAERNMTDTTELNYDFRNPFVICGSTYVPIYRGQKDVSCPYCTARFVPSQEGNICGVCDLAVIGADASGLICSQSQVR
ncbi:hypothetical protein BRARA_F03864 [Brassica rapa]|uniref:Uncharacterized protein n=1 Tax=Brassica campestris TaxID=3711 RepID=A0A397Z916_BRACM|nr:hypothetical protein BRARA_F03864 [Brassica rapa]